MTTTKNVLLAIIITAITAFSFTIRRVARDRAQLRADQMELSHITYGLFDPSEWKEVIARILRSKVEGFELTGADREQVRERTMELMNGLLTEVEGVLKEKNREKGLGGSVKNAVINLVVDMDAIRSGIPRYADMIVEYANDPQNREEMQCYALDKLDDMGRKTDGQVDRSLFEAALVRYECTAREPALSKIEEELTVMDATLQSAYSLLALACATLLILAFGTSPGQRGPLLALITAGVALLLLGLSLPMIDIEARIEEFELVLLGEPVRFTDQVLFHQSKSILQVVQVLMEERKPELMLVAAAVFAFSVILPTCKMLLSASTLIRGREWKGGFAAFVVHRSGKWSMADVLVVAIFMAFIGFNGVVDGQLSSLESYAASIHVLTTNNSALEAGFYLFTGYCALGLIISALFPRALGHPSRP
ncbi:MAG: paraquat-inducible protein A [Flavobacteriales bacterium]